MDNLLKNIHTVDDLDLVVNQLDNLKRHIFETKSATKDLLGMFLTKENELEFSKDLEKSKINIQNPDEFTTLINQTIKTLISIPKISIIFAYVPTRLLLKKVMEEVEGVGNFVFDYTVDPSIYGGIMILAGGVVYDYSIQKIVSGYLSD